MLLESVPFKDEQLKEFISIANVFLKDGKKN